MPIEAAVPDTHPLMKAWAAYTGTDEARNSMSWAAKGGPNALGSMWAAFEAGWKAAHGECAAVSSKTADSLTSDCTHRNGMDPETGEQLCARRDGCMCAEVIDAADTISGKIRARAAT